MQMPDPSAEAMGRFHFAMICLWTLLFLPSLMWWREAIVWVVVMSHYANWVGHFSAWDASRADNSEEIKALRRELHEIRSMLEAR